MFKLIGEPCSAEEVGEIFATVDIDGSGALDFRELVAMLAGREKQKVANTEALEAFRVLAKLQAAAGSNADDERFGTADISAVGGIGLEAVTQALNSLSIQELKHDAVLTEEVATEMLRWMNGPADTLGEVGLVGLHTYTERMLQLATDGDACGDGHVENPVTTTI